MKKYLFEIVALAALILAVGFSVAYADRVPVSASAGLVVIGPCITSSSTIFAFQNPVAATSTLTLFNLWGTNGATSTDIVVATSTSQYVPATASVSNLGENILGMSTVGTSTQFYSVAGQSIGPGTGYNSASGASYKTNMYTVLGPNEWVVGFASSTYTSSRAGALGAGLYSIPTSCVYKAIIVQ